MCRFEWWENPFTGTVNEWNAGALPDCPGELQPALPPLQGLCSRYHCKGFSISCKAEIHTQRVFMAEISMFESYLAHIKDGRNCPFGKGVTQGIWGSNEAFTKVQFDLPSLQGNKAITRQLRKVKNRRKCP